MKILLATRNPAKIRDMRHMLGEFLSVDETAFAHADDFDAAFDVVEDGKTFEENAIKKAREWMERTGLIAVADDGGLEIDALGGEPGVLSRRWPGYEADDETLIHMAIEKLSGVPHEKRTARLRMVMAVAFPDGRIELATGCIEGVIAENPIDGRQAGYPFRSLFVLPELGKYYLNLTPEEHEQHNHRRQALQKLAEFLKNS